VSTAARRAVGRRLKARARQLDDMLGEAWLPRPVSHTRLWEIVDMLVLAELAPRPLPLVPLRQAIEE
jgi:hypothetical protein